MNQREIAEIRRRVRKDRSNMDAIYGCYVNDKKEIVTSFRQSVAMMPENEAGKYFAVLKRALSGTIGKNLVDLSFKTSQVVNSNEHSFLMELRNTALKNDDLRMELFRKIIDAVSLEGSFVILIGCDRYDVPFKSRDGDTQTDASAEVYTYLLCAVCPVKQTKTNLRYVAEDKEFHDGGIAQVIAPPELGFLFPGFDDRSTNIYNALYYSHGSKTRYASVAEILFNIPVPQAADDQKKTFDALLTTSLKESCNMDVLQTVHDTMRQQVEIHKETRNPEPLRISKEQVKAALEESGVPKEGVAKFSVQYDEVFGRDSQLYPQNIINRHFEITTPDVSIKVNPERLDLIETRVIDGIKYIMICADEDVEVNGVSIHINQDRAE